MPVKPRLGPQSSDHFALAADFHRILPKDARSAKARNCSSGVLDINELSEEVRNPTRYLTQPV